MPEALEEGVFISPAVYAAFPCIYTPEELEVVLQYCNDPSLCLEVPKVVLWRCDLSLAFTDQVLVWNEVEEAD